MPVQTPIRTNPPSELPPPAVATVTPAPRAIPPVVDPRTGRTLVPTPGGALDPVSGRVLPQVPGGYLDPGSGRVVPRP
jgi:hypothetical protein